MAIIKSCVKLIIKNDSTYHYSGRALTLGVPEVYATQNELRKWFPLFAKRKFPLSPEEIKITSNEIGNKLGWVTADNFLHSLGYTDILSLDIPGSEHHPDFIHDLNQPLNIAFLNQFDMIIDPGTTEHVFDIKTALFSIVGALKLGGIVIHQVPVYSYNGGYYSINPNVLNDFYSANGFRDLKTYIVMWDRYHAYTGSNLCYEYSDDILGDRHALADYDQCRYSPQMLFFARKDKASADLKIPLQYSGDYMTALSSNNKKSRQSSGMVLIKKIQRVVYRALPYEIAYYMNAIARRWLYLYQSRQVRFWL